MQELNVGRSTIREGLKKLETEDIIEVKNGKGVYVKEKKPFRIYSSFHIIDATKHLLEVLEVRFALEEKAVSLAAIHVTDQQIAEMEHHLSRYLKHRNAKEFELASDADFNFHKVIYKASNNRVLYEIIKSIHEELYVLWEKPGKELLYDEAYPFHIELLQGLKQRDKEKSHQAFYNLVKSVRTNILKLSEEK